jgi:hypothetical protein
MVTRIDLLANGIRLLSIVLVLQLPVLIVCFANFQVATYQIAHYNTRRGYSAFSFTKIKTSLILATL